MPTVTVNARVDLTGLRRWEEAKRRDVAAVIEKYAHLIAREAQALAPVDTGYLRENVTADVSRVLSDLTGYVVSAASYSVWVNYGTSRMQGFFYMNRAFEKHSRAFYDEVRRVLR